MLLLIHLPMLQAILSTATRTVTVVDTTAPVISVTSGTDTVELGATWTDAGATADGGETVTTSGSVDTSTVGTYTITYSATDASGNTSSETRTVTVVDTTAPVVTVTGDTSVTVELGSTYSDAGATATDLSGDVTVVSSGTVDTDTLGEYVITYTSTDASGNTGTATRTVTVVDTTAPVISVTSGTDTVELGATWTDAGATATDLSGDVTVVSSGTVDTDTLGEYVITYTSTDASGNTGTATRTVTVVDTTAPVITVIGDNPATVELNSTYTDEGATADSGETVISTSDVNTAIVGTYTVTYSATDASGNTGTATRTVTVVDTTAPVITVIGDNPATVELNSTYTDEGATADSGETVISTSDVNTAIVGTYTVTYSATDASGNTGTATRTVVVVDTSAPLILNKDGSPLIDNDLITTNENQTAVTSFTADESVTWSLSGTDSGLFAISSSGVLTFASAPDYENPADADTNNDYQLNIIATDIYDNATTLTLIIKVTNTEEVLIKYQEIESKLQSNLEYEISKSLNNSIFYNESILRGINDKNTCYEDESKTQFRSNNNNLNLNYTDQHLECDKALRLYTNISHITLENLNDKTKTSNASVILEKDISSSSLVGIGIIKSKSDGNLYGFDNSNLQIDTSEIIIYAHKNISESFRGGVYTSFGDVDYRFDFSDSDGFYLTGKTESLRKTYGLILTGDFYLNDRLYTTDFIYNYGKEKIDQTHLNASYLGEAKNNLTLSLNNIASRRISLPLSTTFILDKDNKSEATILSADMSIGALCENSLLTMNEFSCGYQLNVDLEKYFNQNYKDIFYINYIYESVDKWNREVVSLGMINKLGKNNDIEISPSIDFNNQFSSIQFTSFNIGFYFPLRYQ